MASQGKHLQVAECSELLIELSLGLPVEFIAFLLMHVHLYGVSNVGIERVVIYTNHSWLREVDGIGAGIILCRVDLLRAILVHDEDRAAVLAADGSQYSSGPCLGRQGIYVIDLAVNLIYIKFIVSSIHVISDQSILACSSLRVSTELSQRETRDGRIICIFYYRLVAVQA